MWDITLLEEPYVYIYQNTHFLYSLSFISYEFKLYLLINFLINTEYRKYCWTWIYIISSISQLRNSIIIHAFCSFFITIFKLRNIFTHICKTEGVLITVNKLEDNDQIKTHLMDSENVISLALSQYNTEKEWNTPLYVNCIRRIVLGNRTLYNFLNKRHLRVKSTRTETSYIYSHLTINSFIYQTVTTKFSWLIIWFTLYSHSHSFYFFFKTLYLLFFNSDNHLLVVNSTRSWR